MMALVSSAVSVAAGDQSVAMARGSPASPQGHWPTGSHSTYSQLWLS
jgi:hypothetical protein